ncbi:MAG: iron-sulfur cluster repair di-iron protein [Acidobacteria bacterium]|nr:iron-sulfur cluster repair di-iron protein [Acidobacteriota bacterium]
MTTTQNLTIAEIAAGSLAAVRVFEHFGIDYCCGGKRTLDEVCREKGLRAEAVEAELAAAGRSRDVETREWSTAPLGELAAHIVNTHHEYLRRELPALSARVAKVHSVHSAAHPERLAGLPGVFEELHAELEMHMRKEEMILFPAITAFEAAVASGRRPAPPPFGTIANPIRMMEMEHESAGSALTEMRRITNGYEIPEYACATYRAMLGGLAALEQDLHLHIHLENNILFPRAIELESRG